MARRNEKSEERSPFGPKTQKAPMWLISEAIDFMGRRHPTVVRMLHGRWVKEGQPKGQSLREFLVATHMTLGRRIRNLLREMKYEWDAAQLDDSYIEVIEKAIGEAGLECQ